MPELTVEQIQDIIHPLQRTGNSYFRKIQDSRQISLGENRMIIVLHLGKCIRCLSLEACNTVKIPADCPQLTVTEKKQMKKQTIENKKAVLLEA